MKNDKNAFTLFGLATVLGLGMSYGSMAVASTGACVSHVSANIMGEEINHRDCVQNVSQPVDVFRQGCEDTAAQSDNLAEEGIDGVEIHEQSTEYVSAGCPADPQGSCNGVSNGEVNYLYWNRTAAQLAETQQACGMIGGDWQDG